jgi:hypothetical protein
MTTRPIQINGTLHFADGSWHVALEAGDPSFEEAMPVRIVLWDDRSISDRSEVERIAISQQLDAGIVALALSAEGAVS